MPARNTEEAAASARCRLAKMKRLDESKVKVVLAEEATWPDASLGAPEQGKSYAQMLVEGYKVILMVDGKAYEVRCGAGAVKVLER